MRRKSLPVKVGAVTIGGDAPVAVQSMTNTATTDVRATLEQINRLFAAGCEIVRVAVPDEKAARALGTIKKHAPLPIIADIHFDFRLALLSIQEGADKVKLIREHRGTRNFFRPLPAPGKGIPLRIGVNSGLSTGT